MAADPQAEGSRLNVESLKNLAAALKEGGYKSQQSSTSLKPNLFTSKRVGSGQHSSTGTSSFANGLWKEQEVRGRKHPKSRSSRGRFHHQKR